MCAALAAPAAASAPHPLALTGCGAIEGVYQCTGLVTTWDGVPLDTTVTLPSATPSGPLPFIADIHGFGNSRFEYLDPASTAYTDNAYGWAKAGYAVLTYTARGLWGSCGTPEARFANPAACAKGYVHLADVRYEARDTQELIGRLVDEGIADPQRLGVTGDSYGGGQSLELAALRNRVMQPDGKLVPWRSPKGTALSLAAAAPVIPWSDLIYAIAPNGRTLTYAEGSPGIERSPVGVFKTSFANGIAAAAQFATGPGQPVGEPFVPGRPMGFLAPPGADPEADVLGWVARADQGEPYDDAGANDIVDRLERFHSPYGIDSSVAPPPLFIGSGFTDDLFPVDEAVRYYNLEHSLFPGDPIGLYDMDFGHMRGQNKPADVAGLSVRINEFFDHYVKGTGPQPPLGATALTQTCPASAPPGGPFTAPTWAALHPGEVDFSSAPAQTIASSAGNPSTSQTIDPITGGGACATVTSTDEGAGVATYRLPAATGNGYTLLGAPTVSANLNATGNFPIIAERLWDVDPASGTQTLVARGLYRFSSTSPNGVQLFQLHPGAWHFAAGHVPKLELLGRDSPYARTSNGTFSISVSDLHLQLPVHDTPGAPGTPSSVTRFHTASLPGPARCSTRPSSRITKRRAHASRHGLSVSGTASANRCAHASSAIQRRERVARVFVMIYRPAAHGRCRFLTSKGSLTRPRSCQRPVEFRAHGTSRWSLRRRLNITRGRYVVRSDAVDGLRHHQRHSGASVVVLRVR